MKKLFYFGLIIAAFWSCSLDDSASEDFHFEILPIENASVPDEMSFGEVYTIGYTYLRPSTCHGFNDLYYVAENNTRTVAVINTVIDNNACEDLTDELVERSFSFFVQNNSGSIIFKFWQGEDENEQDVYLIFEVPIVE